MISDSIKHEAYDLANSYNWPTEARQILDTGTCPKGFGTEVGKAISLFADNPQPGRTRESVKEDRPHLLRLCRLRVLVAKMGIANR